MNRNTNKNEIIKWWKEKIYDKKLSQTQLTNFSGSAGNLLELAFGLTINNKNQSDFVNFELKLYSSKITFGDWKGTFLFEIDNTISRNSFLHYFGKYNHKKKHYYWTVPAIPKFGKTSYRGFFWELKDDKLNLIYDYSKDSQQILVNQVFHQKCLVTWDLINLKKKYENKFSVKIILAQKIKGIHKKLLIINRISWEQFLSEFKLGNIILDSCISTRCKRNRCNFRTSVKTLLKFGYEEYTVIDKQLNKQTYI